MPQKVKAANSREAFCQSQNKREVFSPRIINRIHRVLKGTLLFRCSYALRFIHEDQSISIVDLLVHISKGI